MSLTVNKVRRRSRRSRARRGHCVRCIQVRCFGWFCFGEAPAKAAEVLKPKPLVAGHLAGCTVAKPCPVVKPARTYRKVLTNGKLDGRIGCRYVPKIANEFDRAQILAGAAQYGLSPQQLSALRVCLN